MACAYLSQTQSPAMTTTTTLESILTSLETPVHSDITTHIIGYMRDLPSQQASLVEECATHLERSQTLGAVLAVAHALNGGEILLRHQEKEEFDSDALSLEIEKLLAEEEKKPDIDTLTAAAMKIIDDDSTERGP